MPNDILYSEKGQARVACLPLFFFGGKIMKEFIKRVTAFVLVLSYGLMLVPAQEILRENQMVNDYLMHYGLEENESLTEREIVMAQENGGVYTDDFSFEQTGFLKSSIYGILNEAKQEFLKRYNEGFYEDGTEGLTAGILLAGDEKIKKEWTAFVENFLKTFLSTIDSNASGEFYDEFYQMEREIYNSMLNELLYDHKSLRKEADKDSASIVVSQLINELESSSACNLDNMIDELKIKIENVNALDVNVEAKNWLNDFNTKINAEIEKWDNAEKAFLARKFDFENETYRDYLTQLDQWKNAYDEFEKRKNEWLVSIETKINEGLEIWEEKRSGLETELMNNMEDYKNELYAEYTQKQEILQVNFEIYDQTRQLLNTAENAVKSWCTKWAGRYEGIYSYWKSETADDEENSSSGSGYVSGSAYAFAQYDPVVIPSSNPFYRLGETVITEKNYEEILLKIEGVKKLYKQLSYNKVNDSNRLLWNELNELEAWVSYIGDYSSKLSKTVKTITGIVDDNYKELNNGKNELKIKNSELLEEYLKQKMKIAEAVYEYSIDKTSGVESLETTKENLKQAQSLCEKAKEEYEKARTELENSKNEYYEAKENYKKQKQKVESLLEQVKKIETIYDNTKPDESAARGSELLKNVCALINSVNSVSNEEKTNKQKIKEYIEFLSEEEYDRTYEKALKVIAVLTEESEIESTDENGNIIKQKIASIAELEKTIEAKKKAGKDYGEEKTLLETKLSTIEYIKTGEILDRNNENIDYEKIIETNKEFCVKAQYKNDTESILKIKAVIEKYVSSKKSEADLEEEKLSEFFDELDLVAVNSGCSDYISSALELYKGQILKEREKKYGSDGMSSGGNWETETDSEAVNDESAGIAQATKAEITQATKAEIARLEKVISGYLKESVDIFENKFWVKNYSAVFCAKNFFNVDLSKYDYKEADIMLSGEAEGDAPNDEPAADEKSGTVRLLYLKLFSPEQEYEKYFALLRNTVLSYEKYNEDYENYTKQIVKIQNELDQIRKEYKTELELLNSSKKDSCFMILSDRAELYKEAAAFADMKYDELKNAEFEEEKCRKINEYAENQYLHTAFAGASPENPYDIYQRCLKEYENAVREKEELISNAEKFSFDKETAALLDSYRKQVKDYSAVLALESIAEDVIISKIESLYAEQNKKTEAMLNLVEEYESKAAAGYEAVEGGFYVSETVKRFVDFECGQNEEGEVSYSIKLKTGAEDGGNNSAENEIYVYLTEKNISFYDVKNGRTDYSQSFIDCIDFLESLEKKSYGIDELLLACCYLKMNDDGDKLFFEGEDPSCGENYPFAIPVKELYGLNFEDEYIKGRLNAVNSAYEKIKSAGGLDDIARFIFYAEYNLGSSYEFEKREIDVIATRGMDRVIKGISSKAAQYHNKGVAAAVSCAALLALSFVPFCKWAYAASIAAGLASASYFSNECSLNECKKDVLKIQSGYKEILDEYNEDTDSMLDEYIKSKRNAENALKVLNKCLYGSETCSGGKITYSDFNASIKYMMSDYNYKISEKDFKECIGDAECSDITEVISRIYLAMKSKKDSGFVQLEEKIKEDRENYENWDEIKYQKELYKLYADTMIKNVPVNYMNGTESYIAEGFACLNGCYENILSENVNNLMDQKIFECSLIMQDFENQVADWKNQMNLVVESADYEWQKAEEKLLTEFNLWNRNFNREYEICRQEWNDEYESFLKEKNEWIETQYIKAALSGTDEENKDDVDERVKKYLEIDRRSSSSFANNIDAQKYIDLIYDSSLFENLNGYSCQLNEIAKNYNAAKFNRTDFELNESMRDSLVNSALEKIENDMKDYASFYSLQIARDEIDSAVQDIFDRVEQSNKQMEKWELDLVRKDGYTVSNEIWRNAIIDSTVTENAIREKQTVHRYEYFKCSYPVLSYLLDCSFGYDSNDDVSLMMQKSFDEINSWKSGIFGDETQKGQFEVHVGKAPVFVSRVDTSKNYFENISEIGSGQLGFIMLDFMWNSYKNRDGYTALATPLYDKKITRDNTFLGIELPTIRQITQTVCDIAASATGNALFGFIDEAFYGALDLDFGTKDIDEVTKSFGKAAVNMGVGSAAGKLTASLEGCSNIALKNLGTAAVKTASNYSTSVLNSYIDAMSFENGFSIDFDRANRVWSDGNVLKSAASAGASYLTKVSSATAMRDLDLYDAVGKKLEWKVFNTEGLAALNDVVSTVAASSVEKAITGRTSLSLLNTSDLGFDLKGGDIGLLSVNFDENGTAFRFDESGMQLGVKKSLSAAGALRDFVKITDALGQICESDIR